MPTGFTYFLIKDLCDLKIESRTDRASRYMSEPVINSMKPTWSNIIHSFLVVYTNCRGPRTGRGLNSRIKAVVKNIEGLDLAVDDENADDDKEHKTADNETKKNVE